MGVTVVPQLSVPHDPQTHVAYVPFSPPVPTRRVVLVTGNHSLRSDLGAVDAAIREWLTGIV